MHLGSCHAVHVSVLEFVEFDHFIVMLCIKMQMIILRTLHMNARHVPLEGDGISVCDIGRGICLSGCKLNIPLHLNTIFDCQGDMDFDFYVFDLIIYVSHL